VELPGVGEVKDNVAFSCTPTSFDLKVHGLGGKNYRLLKDNLEKDIVPADSKIVVKRDKVVIKLQKKKGDYSYEHWSALTAKKKRDADGNTKKDPMGGLMVRSGGDEGNVRSSHRTATHHRLMNPFPFPLFQDMMKDMYDDGDANMKKIIGEAMVRVFV